MNRYGVCSSKDTGRLPVVEAKHKPIVGKTDEKETDSQLRNNSKSGDKQARS